MLPPHADVLYSLVVDKFNFSLDGKLSLLDDSDKNAAFLLCLITIFCRIPW